jgi:hypothetical protein
VSGALRGQQFSFAYRSHLVSKRISGGTGAGISIYGTCPCLPHTLEHLTETY